MAVESFIPEVWAAMLLSALEEHHVFAQDGIVNRDYEGDIADFGDTVHIGTLTDPTISNYVKNTTVISPQTLTTADQTLLIDQAKYFAFEVDDVDLRQSRNGGNLMTEATSRAAIGLRDVADSFMAALATTGAGTVLTPLDITTPDVAFKVLRRLRIALDKANVPVDDRWVAVSAEFQGFMLGDNRFLDAAAYGSNMPILNGEIGRAVGFRVLQSNNLPEGTAGTPPEVSNFVIAGHPMAISFAEQINKTVAYSPESAFGDAVKGLHLYGAKVVRPAALAVVDADCNPEIAGF